MKIFYLLCRFQTTKNCKITHKSPCLMCVQYRGGGGAQYCGGCLVPWGILLVLWGDILSNVGVFSTLGDIMITVGDILSTVGGVQYRGRYHEYHGGCSVQWGIPSFKI